MSEEQQQPVDRRHAGAGIDCEVCGGPCTIDDPPVASAPDGFAAAIDGARAAAILRDARDPSRPLPTADELFAAVQIERAIAAGDEKQLAAGGRLLDQALGGPSPIREPSGGMTPADIREFARRMNATTDRGLWTVPPPAPAGAADAALVLYLAACAQCQQADRAAGGEPQYAATPFGRESDRDQWAERHALQRGHRVALVEQHPATGSTITRYVHGPEVGAERVRASVPYEPPLIAFVVRSGKDPDLLCTIPDRAGAAWLLTAAHATMLGRGSLGIPQPHRVLYVGRLTRVDMPGDQPGQWRVRIDGLIGATDETFGKAVGMTIAVASHLDPGQVEDVCEAMIAEACKITRNLFSVVVMTDAPTAEPPDEHAEHVLREQRLAARGEHRDAGGPVPETLVEFVDRGPVAEVAETAPER